MIVFNGYLQGPYTKDHEHVHRSKNMTANIQLCSSMIAQGSQQSFLSNEINMMDVLRVGHGIYQAKNDADTNCGISPQVLHLSWNTEEECISTKK